MYRILNEADSRRPIHDDASIEIDGDAGPANVQGERQRQINHE